MYIYNAHFNLLQTIANKPQFEVVYNSPCGFPGGLVGKESACSAGDPGSIPGWGRYPGEGKGNPLQHSCLENPMDRGAWRATVHGVAKSRATPWTEGLSG